ncbi:hypothetical protein BACCAP_00575 [Pseudoflavonifractor capillosus ATCC 29799]|uniref:Uncharacterized protein n=1 Tax=Pseudoflavonifractor capillosus ATCC 29799 TaxID=411467 RepID=A6NQV2_9FIRM|nr:hypothetical protein BACCAP_00575 [Pseudoflavonifractor capillosus ATCC 29799]
MRVGGDRGYGFPQKAGSVGKIRGAGREKRQRPLSMLRPVRRPHENRALSQQFPSCLNGSVPCRRLL